MPSKKQTPAVIQEEIGRLNDMRDSVREKTLFGDNNRYAIDAQIQVLKDDLGESEVYERFGEEAFIDKDEYCEYDFSNAMDAVHWRNGEKGAERPSEVWEPLCDVPAKKPKRRQLISSDEAVQAKCQHTTPCPDCPWGRAALNGWLGGGSVEDWIQTAHSDAVVPCHTLKGAQCAGIAIYRRNVCKQAYGENLKLERDTVKVFASPMEFRAHHESLPGGKPKKAKKK